MKTCTFSVLIVIAFLGLASCAFGQFGGAMRAQQADNDLMQQKLAITDGFDSNPDLDTWYEQRQKIAQAMGDRVFDIDFGRVYDSLVVAVSSLELKVNNMERTSGFIQASGITLPPTQSKTMYREALNEWSKQKGLDSSVLDQKFRTPAYQNMGGTLGDAPSSNPLTGEKKQKSITFQLVKMGDNQTKVKLRFSEVYYPRELEEYCKLVWQAVDKQIFVDKNIEGAVEERK